MSAPADMTLFLEVDGSGPPDCFDGYKMQLNLDLYDWDHPNDPWTQSYNVNVLQSGFHAQLLGPLGDYFAFKHGLSLEKMVVWVQSSKVDPQDFTARTIPFDLRMCDPTPDHPFGGSTVDCGYHPSLLTN
ncbi:hypothetical protein F0L68_11905 [Solihabitans fulvus]|uniref:Uncharacterized protein n=1 Tax=Solihabitans fulvus TaxID=1892852 RepID=A0A5B2XIN0_9PSEU|nr:hypothetical protein [Solihabitans fulvus]KAA2262602.1 hypothetical protein F0L68_11905 [Solihabitans fulvus]